MVNLEEAAESPESTERILTRAEIKEKIASFIDRKASSEEVNRYIQSLVFEEPTAPKKAYWLSYYALHSKGYFKESYHVRVVSTSFKDPGFIGKWKELGKRPSRSNPWINIKLEVPEERLEELVTEGQKLLISDKFYFHAYRGNELIVVFPERIFRLTPDKSTWGEMVKYCRECGIPEGQDVSPARFEEEDF